MKDFLLFKRMVTPIIIQALFWLLLVMVISSVISYFIHKEIFTGIITLILGPIFVRVLCETIIVFFRINDNLADIRHKTAQKK
jgi:hypothetical protein